ncbi:MAG: hypothetical protein ACAI35_10895 [Candidatus Methylacidiphilales bacterium]|nr:hypothetical protein [Candidatus Methylacidiphilales bacterium]
MRKIHFLKLLVLAPLMLSAPLANAQMKLDESLAKTASVVVPKPSELFSAMTQLNSTVDWTKVVAYVNAGKLKGRFDYATSETRALNLGVRLANGAVAVQARDKKSLEEISKAVKSLADSLGIRKELLAQADVVEELARAEKWPELLSQLDKLQEDILTALKERKDTDSVTLVRVAGWLQGLHLVTFGLEGNYHEKSSGLLRQPQLADDIASELGKLKVKDPLIDEVKAGVLQIKPLIDVAKGAPVPKDNVVKLHAISHGLVDKIEQAK